MKIQMMKIQTTTAAAGVVVEGASVASRAPRLLLGPRRGCS